MKMWGIALVAMMLIPGAVVAEAPSTEALPSVLREGMLEYLKDPASAQIEITRRARWGSTTTKRGTYTGWLICGQMNAKNSYGGYIGYEDYLFVIDDAGKVLPLKRLSTGFPNTDAWRAECYLPRPDPADNGP